VDFLSLAGAVARESVLLAAEEGAEPAGLVINFFWVIVSAANFLFFLFVLYRLALGPVGEMLRTRRERIEQGLKDAEQARRDRERAEEERVATLAEARREANDILARAQKVAQDTRDADIAATREELDRMRTRATAEIEAEKHRALADLRSEVADLALAAAGKVVGESMTDQRQRRLVEDFLRESSASGSSS
jgi:F-type H+-transporting ATPase subunit b